MDPKMELEWMHFANSTNHIWVKCFNEFLCWHKNNIFLFVGHTGLGRCAGRCRCSSFSRRCGNSECTASRSPSSCTTSLRSSITKWWPPCFRKWMGIKQAPHFRGMGSSSIFRLGLGSKSKIFKVQYSNSSPSPYQVWCQGWSPTSCVSPPAKGLGMVSLINVFEK